MEKKYILAINYKSIILGAITKFGSIDNVDFHILTEEFTKKTGIRFKGNWKEIGNYDEYIEIKQDGTAALRDGIELNSRIREEDCTVYEKLLNEVDPRVKEFFDNLDIEKYERLKEKFLQKERILNKANVLLISDVPEDYEGLIRSGFKRVDYFKSIIRADSYFENRQAELENYHLILIGNQNVQKCCLFGFVDLEDKLEYLKSRTPAIHVYIRREGDTLETNLSDKKNHKSWKIQEQTIEGFYDRVIENILINKVLEQSELDFYEFSPYVEYINPNRFIPKSKENLRVLYLDSLQTRECHLVVASDLGLNITFKEDGYAALGEYVKSHLGDYDIIIASHLFSSNILGMNRESTEQCKDTGRELTLLITYEEPSEEQNRALKIQYVYGGNLAPTSDTMEKEVRVLRKEAECNPSEDEKQIQGDYSNVRTVIELAVNLYNEALKTQNKPIVEGTTFKISEVITDEYICSCNKTGEIKQAVINQEELEPIKAFDTMTYSILSYLSYKKSKKTKSVPQDIRFIEGIEGVTVENLIGGVVVCRLTFKREYKEEGLRIFILESPTKKGILSSPEKVGLYTSAYESRENVPSRPTPLQANAISALAKKVAYAVRPINAEAWGKRRGKRRKLTLKDSKKPTSE